ncbi:MAG: putative PEP-binding protein [Acidiferrobacterales bacterium]
MNRASVHITGLPYFPGQARGELHKGTSEDNTGRILLLSQQEVTMIGSVPAGIIVVEAAPFSHTMIGLLGVGVPTVLVSAEQAAQLQEGMQLVIDGVGGDISDDPAMAAAAEAIPKNLVPGQAVQMADGEPVALHASVRSTAAASRARATGARSIGLVRTEFIVPDNAVVPDRSFYFQAFRDLCEAAAPLSVTFRLLDVAADKVPIWLAGVEHVDRPLGNQGVRLYHLKAVQVVVEAQLAALAELSAIYSIRVLLPFLSSTEEFDYWMANVRQQLSTAVPVGAMAETPAMVLDIARLLMHADFVSIGCNDLIQALFAADRDIPELRHYLDGYSPVLYRLFGEVAEQAGERLDRIQLCGVLPQMRGVLPVLLGLGYRDFSVDAPFIPYLATQLATVNKVECEALAKKVCAAGTTREVVQLLQ